MLEYCGCPIVPDTHIHTHTHIEHVIVVEEQPTPLCVVGGVHTSAEHRQFVYVTRL